MKKIFAAWYYRENPGSKSDWAHKAHAAFREYYKRNISIKNTPPQVTINQVKSWLVKMGIIVIDKKDNGKDIRRRKGEII